MKKTSRFRLVAAVLCFVLLALAYVVLSTPNKVQAAAPQRPIQLSTPDAGSFSSRYSQAAQALREKNLQTARQHLDEVIREHSDEAVRARLVEGLYAYEAGDSDLAEELLSKVSIKGGELEDWRLFLLAESAQRDGHLEAAGDALARLIGEYPKSPLCAKAYLQAARLALQEGDERQALGLIDGARHAEIRGEEAVELEHLAWKLGKTLDDDQVSRDAARQLLVRAPLTAGALGVASSFRAVDGSIDWSSLSAGEVKQRALSFLDVERLSAALDTLENVPATERDLEWHLIKARALTESNRGRDALSVLDEVAPSDPLDRAGVEWERARATGELGTARGGASLSVAQRRTMLEASHRHLANVVELGASDLLTEDALRRLYEEFLEAGLFEQSMDALRILRRVDPRDTTGTRELWERGWQEYRRNNYTGAVAYWSELADIYPGQGDAQRGLYWKARALERLRQPDRARGVYSDLVAASDTTDFYRRRAMARLGVEPVSSQIELARATAPWPEDPTLQRAKLLTDLGLDGLAQREMELVRAQADGRDLLALKALIMGRQGQRRAGIALLREAFPELGGARQTKVPDEILRAYYPLEYEDTIRAQAKAQGIEPALIAGIIRQESAFDPRATSPVGARGLMQLMPTTAQETARRMDRRFPSNGLYDPEFSIELGSAYFRQLLDSFDGNVELALAGYNGGPNRIRRLWNEAGPSAELDDFVENLGLDESRDYVKRILVLADSYRQLYPNIG
ncbi:MAG TPA: transglycosylase SLT domain-containing protein [Thermoanaerobaculia bacterium]|nr:transglycosylase SLT domain-containing protein [Thermoanaerobaculia bacterium]